MQAFLCTNCPLAFEIGHYLYWGLDGGTDRLVCIKCGTMHWLDFRKPEGAAENDAGTTTFRALPEPIREIRTVTRKTEFGDEFEDYEWPFENNDWLTVDSWSGRQSIETLICNHCQTSGKLISLEHPKTDEGCWPIFRDKDGDEHCPVCDGPIECLYDVTVN